MISILFWAITAPGYTYVPHTDGADAVPTLLPLLSAVSPFRSTTLAEKFFTLTKTESLINKNIKMK